MCGRGVDESSHLERGSAARRAAFVGNALSFSPFQRPKGVQKLGAHRRTPKRTWYVEGAVVVSTQAQTHTDAHTPHTDTHFLLLSLPSRNRIHAHKHPLTWYVESAIARVDDGGELPLVLVLAPTQALPCGGCGWGCLMFVRREER